MRKITLILITLILIAISAQAGMTKFYVGVENNQFIYGIEARAIDLEEGMFGLDLRHCLKKEIVKENGLVIVEQPAKFKTSITLAGINEEILYAYELEINRIFDSLGNTHLKNSLSTKLGSGRYLFYE